MRVRWVARLGLGVVVMILIADALLALRNTQDVATLEGRVAHTQAERFELEAVLSAVRDAETGQRGFLVTGRDGYLDPYRQALVDVHLRVAELARLAADDREQQGDLEAVRRLVDSKLAELRETIALRRDDPDPQHGFESARQVVLSDRGKQAMDDLRRVIAGMDGRERTLLAARKAQLSARYRTAVVTTLASLGLGLALVGMVFAVDAKADGIACRAVAAAKRERERLDLTLRLLPVGVFICEADGRMVAINDAVVRLWGNRAPLAQSVAEYHIYRGYKPGTNEPIASEEWALARALRGEAPVDEDVEIVSFDGERKTMLNSALALRDPDGTITGGVAINVDITDRKQAERERAREAEFRERFIGILGHDLRTPLSAITLSAHSLLGRAALDNAEAQGLQRIVRSADRMARMIRDLLDFTRARQGGGIPVTLEPDDLEAICRRVLEEVKLSHPGRAVALRSVGGTGGRWDPDRIAQVIQNLMINAFDYSPTDTPVEVAVDGSGERVVLAVTNEGPPIPSELRADLFNPFRRGAHAPEGRASQGLGLGLYIAHEIVIAHHGRIWVESDQARGTTFRVELPRSLAQAV